MDNDSKFWLSIWGGIAVTILIILYWCFGAVQASAKLDAERYTAAIKAGADPITAHCGVYGAYGNDAICTLAAIGHPQAASAVANGLSTH